MFGRKKEIARLEQIIANRNEGLAHARVTNKKKDEQIRRLIDSHQGLQAAAIVNVETQIANAYDGIYDTIDYLTRLGIEPDLISDAFDRYLYGDGERETARLKLHEPS